MSRLMMVALAALLTAGEATAADRFPAEGGEIVITPLVHASVQIEHAGKVILVDPWSYRGSDKAKPGDLILITDDNGHHLDLKALEGLRKPSTTIVIAGNGKAKLPDGIVLANGESMAAGGIKIEAVAAYDIIPGPPEHPKGEANGYVLTLGGKRIYVAGVTECVPEVQALKDIDIAFLPMNVPQERMTPKAVADCAKIFKPKIVYAYHYDQDYASHAINGPLQPKWLPGGITVAQSLQALKDGLAGASIEVRSGEWYP